MKKTIIFVSFLFIFGTLFCDSIQVKGIDTINITNVNGPTSLIFDNGSNINITSYNTLNTPINVEAINGLLTISTRPTKNNLPTNLNITIPQINAIATINILSKSGRITIENFPSDIALSVITTKSTVSYYGSLENLHVSANGGIFYNGVVMESGNSKTWNSGSGALKTIINKRDDVWITKPVN